MAAIACLVGPHRRRAADDIGGAQHAKIPPVEAVRRGRVHDEQLAGAEHSATEPCRQRTAQLIARAGDASEVAVDGHTVTKTADALAANGGDALEERNAGREVTTFREQASKFRRRVDGDTLANMEARLASDRIWLFSDLPNRRNDYGLIEHTSWCRNRSCTPYHGNENADFRRLEPGSAKSGCQASAPTGETLRQGPIRNHRRAQAFVTDRRQAQALTVAPPSFRLNLTGPAPSGTCRAGLPEMTSIGEQPPIASRMPSRSRPRR